MNHVKATVAFLLFMITIALFAQDRIIDREQEKKDFPEIQESEAIAEQNILGTYNQLKSYGHLVQMAKEDRVNTFLEIKDPNNMKYMARHIKFTPHNSYSRYVKEDPALLLLGLGELKDIQALISEKIKLANNNGVAAKEIQFQSRDGIELTDFAFIYDPQDPKHKAIGSVRKTLTLFFKPAGQTADQRQAYELDLVVGRLVDDNMRDGVKNVEVFIDPSPLDAQMDDFVIIHRKNFQEPSVIPLGIAHNTPNAPHRLRYKQRFHTRLLDHFYRLYTLVDSYAKKDGNKYNETVIEEMEDVLSY